MLFLRRHGGLVLTLIVCAAVYLGFLDNPPVFDDSLYADGYLAQQYAEWSGFRQRLLAYSSFLWIDAMSGGAIWAQRLVNIALHLLTACGLYVLLKRVVWDQSHTDAMPSAPLRALQVGVAVFALNPVAVYCVGYLIQRSLLMATCLVVWALWCASRAIETRRWTWALIAFAGYLAAVMSKEYALPALLLVVPLWILQSRPSRRTLLLGSVGALVVGLAVAIPFFWLYRDVLGRPFDPFSIAHLELLDAMHQGSADQVWLLSIVNQAYRFLVYGGLWVLPNVTSMSVDLRPAFPLTFWSFPHLIGVVGYLAVWIIGCWLLLRRDGAMQRIGFLLLVPAILFLTEFATVWLQDPFVLYRSYLWAIALPGLLALLLRDAPVRVLNGMLGVVIVVFAGLSAERLSTFRSEIALWSDAVEKVDVEAPDNAFGRWRPYLNRGNQYLASGLPDLALADFRKAAQLGDFGGSAQFGAGMAFVMAKDDAAAIDAFDRAEADGFSEAALFYQRGVAQARASQPQAAIADLKRALELGLDDALAPQVRLQLAELALSVRDLETARTQFAMLRGDQPDDVRVLIGSGMVAVGLGQFDEALGTFDRVLAARELPIAHYGRGLALAGQGNAVAAAAALDRAIALEPSNTAFRNAKQRLIVSD